MAISVTVVAAGTLYYYPPDFKKIVDTIEKIKNEIVSIDYKECFFGTRKEIASTLARKVINSKQTQKLIGSKTRDEFYLNLPAYREWIFNIKIIKLVPNHIVSPDEKNKILTLATTEIRNALRSGIKCANTIDEKSGIEYEIRALKDRLLDLFDERLDAELVPQFHLELVHPNAASLLPPHSEGVPLIRDPSEIPCEFVVAKIFKD